MENSYKVCQNYFRFNRHAFVEWFPAHIAVYHLFLLECLKICISYIFSLQGFIGEISFITVHYSPVVGIRSLAIHGFKIERYSSGANIIFKEVIGTGVLEKLCQETLSTYGIPVSASEFATEYHRTLLHLRCEFGHSLLHLSAVLRI